MPNLFIREDKYEIRRDLCEEDERRIGLGDSDVYETIFCTIGELFKYLVRQHGKCVSKMYVDGKNGEAIQRGWVFQKRGKGGGKSGKVGAPLIEMWVTVYTAPPKVRWEHFYYNFNQKGRKTA